MQKYQLDVLRDGSDALTKPLEVEIFLLADVFYGFIVKQWKVTCGIFFIFQNIFIVLLY